MSNRVLAYDRVSGRALWLAKEIRPEGLHLMMTAGGHWIGRTVSGPAADAAYEAFDNHDAEAFGEIMFPTEVSTQAAPVRRSPEDVAA